MKKRLILIALFVLSLSINDFAQVVSDPLLNFYKTIIESGRSSPDVKIYSFDADFTGNGKKSFFITTDLIEVDRQGDYAWTVFYPLSSGGYQELADNLQARVTGPDYIGYIKEIKNYGIVTAGGSVGKMIVFAYLLKNGNINWRWLGHNLDDPSKSFPRYFSSTKNWNIQTYTVAQLAQKYPSVNASNTSKSAPQ